MYITVRMQKTQQLVNNPVSEEALELIGFYDGEGYLYRPAHARTQERGNHSNLCKHG